MSRRESYVIRKAFKVNINGKRMNKEFLKVSKLKNMIEGSSIIFDMVEENTLKQKTYSEAEGSIIIKFIIFVAFKEEYDMIQDILDYIEEEI